MALLYENKYTVSREDGVKYHSKRPWDGAPRHRKKQGGMIRAVGLCAACVIMFMSFLTEMPIFFFIGLLLAIIYIFRMINARDSGSSAHRQKPSYVPHELKWTRIIRFDTKIRVIDPQLPEEFEYGDIIKITEDSAYATLWVSDGNTVRVSKQGFTTGTWESFQIFINDIIERNTAPFPEDRD